MRHRIDSGAETLGVLFLLCLITRVPYVREIPVQTISCGEAIVGNLVHDRDGFLLGKSLIVVVCGGTAASSIIYGQERFDGGAGLVGKDHVLGLVDLNRLWR
jgi:hypothetical protein